MKNITKIYLISFLAVLIPFSAQAFSLEDFFDDWEKYFGEESFESVESTSNVEVINKINVSARTGGNVAGEGEIIEGEATAKVEIENIINGQSIEPVDLEVKSAEGEAKVEVEQKITYPDEEGRASVEREIEINEQAETEEYQVEIEDTDLTQPENIEPSLEEAESLEEPENLEKPKLVSKLTNKLSQWWLDFLGGLKEKLASIVSFWK